MILHRPLNQVLRSWTHIAVLRTLQDTTVGFTGNQIAREACMHPRSALKALSTLETLGLVYRQRGGRDHLFTLNRDHVLVAEGVVPLLRCERQMMESLTTELESLLKGKVVVAIIFGSVARQEEQQGSDVDICCVVDENGGTDIVQDSLDASASRLFRRYGVKLAPMIFTETEFRKKRTTPLVRAIVSEGMIIVGELPGIVRHG